MASRSARLRGIAGIALAQLRHYRWRTVLAVVGVAVAVLLVTLLSGLGHGVTTRGMAALDQTNRDLWVGTRPEVAPGSIGGISNQLYDAHEIARDIESRPDVRGAQAISFQTVYVSPDDSGFATIVGVGITGTSAPLPLQRGEGFTHADRHYADGTYDGEWTREVIVDESTARRFDLDVGDTLHIGGTLVSARENEFTVVGVSSTFSSFVGLPTVVLHLSELQELTASTRSDPASLVAVTVADGADVREVAASLQEAYPEYSVRTNQEQFRATLRRQGPVIAGVVSLVALALVIGLALVGITLALLVRHQRIELAILRANGVSSGLLTGMVVLEGICIGLLGGLIGVLSTPPLTVVLNGVVADLTGTSSLIRPTGPIMIGGLVMAIGVGSLGSAAAVWQITRSSVITDLR